MQTQFLALSEGNNGYQKHYYQFRFPSQSSAVGKLGTRPKTFAGKHGDLEEDNISSNASPANSLPKCSIPNQLTHLDDECP